MRKGVRTCARVHLPIFRISGMAGRIRLKFGIWVKGPLAMLVTLVGDAVPIFARTHVRTPSRISASARRIALKFRCGLVIDQLTTHFIHATIGVHLHVLMCVPVFPHLGIHWTHDTEM